VTRPGAYSLRLADGQLDASLFEHLAKKGRSALAANAPDQAAAKLRTALQLGRGRALADLGDGAELRIEAARLEELRLGATEDRIEADLGWPVTRMSWTSCRRSWPCIRCASACMDS
jgi:Bacterial transcriptional activator domain